MTQEVVHTYLRLADVEQMTAAADEVIRRRNIPEQGRKKKLFERSEFLIATSTYYDRVVV